MTKLTSVSDVAKGRAQVARPSSLLREARGATVVELLTAIVIAGILAGLAVPAFFHHRDRARDAQAKANVRAAQAAAMEIGQGNGGRFNGPDGVTVTNLIAVDESLDDVSLTVPFALPDTYAVRVQSETGNTFDVTHTSFGATDLSCASADDGGCPADGTWD
jgi:type II secretory pathway pseudopilin PulG